MQHTPVISVLGKLKQEDDISPGIQNYPGNIARLFRLILIIIISLRET